ncbi:MAG: hypothetical protein HYV26_15480 [Candidatus Hydrogenedentes bacterium]|nr:hypothetical protein [Candidatus Hydrogenedentota bacterium]
MEVVDEVRRANVARLLKHGTDEKLLKSSAKRAKEILQDAYDKSPGLPRPWPQIAAYRLALILLREGNSARLEDLERIDQLLNEATMAESEEDWNKEWGLSGDFGVMPRLYRLAVLHRMLLQKPAEERDDIRRKIEQVRRRAIQLAQRPPIREGDRAEERVRRQVPLQNDIFNALELATFFLDCNYAPLEGVGCDPAYFPENGWVLLGRHSLTDKVVYTAELAEAELEDRLKADAQAISFILPESVEEPRWRKGPGRYERLRRSSARLLGCLLQDVGVSRDRLRRALPDSSDDSFRQALLRLKDDLAEMTGLPREKTVQCPEARGLYELSPQITIMGIAHAATLAGAR